MTAYVVFSRERMRNRVEYEIYREKSRPVNVSRTADPIELAVLAQLEQLTASFRVSTGSGLSRIKGLGWAEG